MISDELKHLMDSLAFTIGLILKSDDQDRHRIALAYQEAQELAATIPLDDGDARPKILACFERFNALEAHGDIAAAGWLLWAIQERLSEKNLAGWDLLMPAVQKAVELLTDPRSTLH